MPDITPARVVFEELLLFKVLEFKFIVPSTDTEDAVTFDPILKLPSVETVKPPPAVIPPEPIVKFPVVVVDEPPIILAYPFPAWPV